MHPRQIPASRHAGKSGAKNILIQSECGYRKQLPLSPCYMVIDYTPSIRYCYCDLRRCRSITIPVAPPLSSALPGLYRPCGLAKDVNAVGIAIFGALCGPVLRRVMPVRAWTGPVVWIRAFASRPSAMCIIRAMACRRGSSWRGIRSRSGWMFPGRVCYTHLGPL